MNNLFIIGAGRSGTNILRDILCEQNGFETWPCDEINYIWRHGNLYFPTDRFTSEQATPFVRNYLIDTFEKFDVRTKAKVLVEKTCANSLRIPFIEEVFDKPKYLVIVRNGYDVAASARVRWTAPMDFKYILRKAKYVPVSDIGYYAFKYARNRISKLISNEKRLAYWGPIYPGMKADLERVSALEICAKQWRSCLTYTLNDIQSLDAERLQVIDYNTFVERPFEILSGVLDKLSFNFDRDLLKSSVESISNKSVNNYLRSLSAAEIELIAPIVDPVMDKYVDV